MFKDFFLLLSLLFYLIIIIINYNKEHMNLENGRKHPEAAIANKQSSAHHTTSVDNSIATAVPSGDELVQENVVDGMLLLLLMFIIIR